MCPPPCLLPALAQILPSQGAFSSTSSLDPALSILCPALSVPCPALSLPFYTALTTSEQTASFICWVGLLFDCQDSVLLANVSLDRLWHLVGAHNNLPVDCMVEWVCMWTLTYFCFFFPPYLTWWLFCLVLAFSIRSTTVLGIQHIGTALRISYRNGELGLYLMLNMRSTKYW